MINILNLTNAGTGGSVVQFNITIFSPTFLSHAKKGLFRSFKIKKKKVKRNHQVESES